MKNIKISVEGLNLYYGDVRALKDLTIGIPPNRVTAIIGPSGCGKSTFLRVLNRLNDLIPSVRVEGKVAIDDLDIYSRDVDVVELRKKVGMVFQKSNPFPKSIFENVAFGPRIHGVKNRSVLEGIVVESLKKAALWEEVNHRLYEHAFDLSGGQQQRLCIARALAVNPDILLMDEPASALDPVSTVKIEDLMDGLKENYTVVIVTHNMQQAARVADYTAFLLMGELVEYRPTKELFTKPNDKRTEDYVTGRFG